MRETGRRAGASVVPRARIGLAGALCLAIAGAAVALSAGSWTIGSAARAQDQKSEPIKSRNLDVPRAEATRLPRSEADQAIVDGWPLYRTPRGQAAFNDAMATLRATEGPAPARDAFKGCTRLDCNVTLPGMGPGGWLQPGRIWVSADEYVLIAHSPRIRNGRAARRHSARSLRYFVFHEFHNSSRNTDPYDTISSHSGSVFVPFYMTKQGVDAKGRRFVIVIQVAPYDTVSIHATNFGSAGPGIEVAKNMGDPLETLQGLAGIVVASIVKEAMPRLKVVNHRGTEGLPMLQGYEQRLAALRTRSGGPTVTLPFVAASMQRVASVTGRLEDVLARPGVAVARAAQPEPTASSRKLTSGMVPTAAVLAAPAPAPVLVAPVRLATRPAQSPSAPPTDALPEPVLTGPVRPAVRPPPFWAAGIAR